MLRIVSKENLEAVVVQIVEAVRAERIRIDQMTVLMEWRFSPVLDAYDLNRVIAADDLCTGIVEQLPS